MKDTSDNGAARWNGSVAFRLRTTTGCFERIPAEYGFDMGLVVYHWEISYVDNLARLLHQG